MTIESIFAFIFSAPRSSEFVIKLSYIEISNEQMFDLLNGGKFIRQNDKAETICIKSIEDAL